MTRLIELCVLEGIYEIMARQMVKELMIQSIIINNWQLINYQNIYHRLSVNITINISIKPRLSETVDPVIINWRAKRPEWWWCTFDRTASRKLVHSSLLEEKYLNGGWTGDASVNCSILGDALGEIIFNVSFDCRYLTMLHTLPLSAEETSLEEFYEPRTR